MGSRPSKKRPEDPPFKPENEVIPKGGKGPKERFEECPKNHRHQFTIPVEEFDVRKHLPPQYHTEAVKKHVQIQSARTVKISTKFTSPSRPDTYPGTRAPYPYCKLKGDKESERTGSGFVVRRPQLKKGCPCPCPPCVKSGNPVIGYVVLLIMTAAHVVFDDLESKAAVCELFYDSEEDRSRVRTLYGQTMARLFNVEDLCCNDMTFIPFVTHDLDVMETLPSYTVAPPCAPLPLIVSHPHGRSKRISIGTFCHLITPQPANFPLGKPFKFQAGVIPSCRISASAPLGTRKRLQRFLNLPQPCIPDLEYQIKNAVTIILPPDAKYLCQGLIPKVKWAKFPKDTIFLSTENGSESILLPGVQFDLSRAARVIFPTGEVPYYMIYDVDTCPGSSGATIVDDCTYGQGNTKYLNSTHAGVLENDINRSGTQIFQLD